MTIILKEYIFSTYNSVRKTSGHHKYHGMPVLFIIIVNRLNVITPRVISQ